MSRVLIWNRVRPQSELDIFHPTDYNTLFHRVKNEWNGRAQNYGNRLWFQGIYSAIDTGENTYDFLPDVIDPEKINSEYDFIILSMANIFNPDYAGGMRHYTEVFAKIRIPVYVIACGVQADSYDALPKLLEILKEDASAFIRSVYNTGGEFALRGYFTKEFFDKLGFHSAVVTGCPSLFQRGPDFQVCTAEVPNEQLLPVFNGFPDSMAELLRAYPNSVFMDQCDYFPLLYDPDFLQKTGYRFELMFVNNFGSTAANLMADGRLMMIADMNDWSRYLRNSGFNYSFGSRIHGTIMALLSGIPATIVTIDSRTREMAEFFDIPRHAASPKHKFSGEEFLALHERMDYSDFNRKFKSRFDAYERFLADHHIVSHVNPNNGFFDAPGGTDYMNVVLSRKTDFAVFSEKLDRDRSVLALLSQLRRIKLALRGHRR